MQYIKDKLLNRQCHILDSQESLNFAVLLPLVYDQGKPSVLFEVRSSHLKSQPGETCFPGGHIEKFDTSPRYAALRETSEELGIRIEDIELLGNLDTLITQTHLIVHSFVGFIDNISSFSLNTDEVKEVFTVPLEFLLNCQPLISKVKINTVPEKDFPFHLIPGGNNYNWRIGSYPVYFYHYNGYVIWGMTAKILHHFLELIR